MGKDKMLIATKKFLRNSVKGYLVLFGMQHLKPHLYVTIMITV